MEDRKRVCYFRRQKAAGFTVILLGLISMPLLAWDLTFGLVMIATGLYVVCTKEMIWMDEYYYEVKKKERYERRTKSPY